MKYEFSELIGETFVAKRDELYAVQIFIGRRENGGGYDEEDRGTGIAGAEGAFLLPFRDIGAEKTKCFGTLIINNKH